jgi:hypothetical protein
MRDSKASTSVKRRLPEKPDEVAHLLTQAERARRMASECGSQLVADLFEMHAQLCERNAQMQRQCRRRPIVRALGNA